MALIIKEGPVQTQEAEAFLVVSNSLQLNDKAEGGVCLSWEQPKSTSISHFQGWLYRL